MIKFQNLNEISFESAREIQNELVSKRQKNLISDTIIFCEHPATLTQGIRSKDSELLLPKEQLGSIQIVKTDRGGEWTAHAPGQLVIYPVIDLKARKLSPKCLVNVLLDTVTSALIELGISAVNSSKPLGVLLPGIFVANRKIGSIGLKISRGVTNHGLSLNVSNSLEIFKLIIPCGLADIEMTSVSKELGRTMETTAIIPIIEHRFIRQFGD